MFDQNGLSLDQAPPISVVFGLFLIGSIFGILSGVAIAVYQNEIFIPSSTGTVVTTHIISLGVMGSFMFGALFQMLPVIAGTVLDSPVKRSNILKLLFVTGIVMLISGFIFHLSILFLLASFLLGGSLIYTSLSMGIKLVRLNNHSASSRGMVFSLLSLFILVLLALYMTLTYAGVINGIYFLNIRHIHYSFGVFGWISLLIISISFQTIEMFYVTPAYPLFLSHYIPVVTTTLLGLILLFVLFQNSAVTAIEIILYFAMIIYGGFTLLRLSQRKRPLADATIWFWRTGMGSLIFSMVLLIITAFVSNHILTSMAVILFCTFALSILFAMFYKIVPFLTWFHLNAQGYFTAPMMHEVIHPKTAKKHYYIHLSTVILFILSLLIPQAILFAGIGMILSFGWVGYQILHANRLYKKTQETGERFDMNMMK